MTKAAELAALIGSQTAQTGRNLWINGAMNVAQRSTSVTGLGDGNEGYVTVDRMRESGGTASAGRYTSKQTAITDLPGFANCFHVNCTTADTSIAAGELLFFGTRLEGQDLQRLAKGTSSAEPITISWYMKTNKAFTFVLEVKDIDNTRDIQQKFTTTTDWTRHSLTFVADTTGALDDDNARSLDIHIWVHAGSTYSGGTFTSNTWSSVTNANRAVGIGSFYDSTDNDLKMTGFQVEIGEVATPFEHEDFGTTLAKCQRYYNKTGADAAYSMLGVGFTQTTRYAKAQVFFPVEMRSAPTLGQSANNTLTVFSAAASPAFNADAAINNPTTHSTNITCDVSSGLTAGQGMTVMANNSTAAFFEFIAEL
jgi:hypothetical protein